MAHILSSSDPLRLGLALALVVQALPGCGGTTQEGSMEEGDEGGDTTTETGAEGDVPAVPDCAPRRLVTADWLERRLSIFDLELLSDPDVTLDDARVGTIDLSDHAPGPQQLAIHPDGRRAVVAVGPGFFGGSVGALIGAGDVPGGGLVLVVDLVDGTILAELETPQPPMGVILDDAGERAFVANYGDEEVVGSTVTTIDLGALTVLGSTEVGARPEQLAWTEGGLVVNAAGDGLAVILDTGTPVPTVLGAVVTSEDPSSPLWHAAWPGQVLMTDSQGPAGVSLVDIADTTSPTVATRVDMSGFPYAIAQGDAPEEVWVLASLFASVDVHALTVGALSLSSESPVNVDVAGFPLGALWLEGGLWFTVPGDGALVRYEPGTTPRVLSWPSAPGPTWVAEAASTCP